MDDKEMFDIILRKSYLLGEREKDRWRRLRIKQGKEDSITERETKEKERYMKMTEMGKERGERETGS